MAIRFDCDKMNKEEIANWFSELQSTICNQLEIADGNGKFQKDAWTRPEGGGGLSRVIINGNIIEKGGVNFSAVSGPTPKKIIQALQIPQEDFFATGVSIVLHPKNPFVPIIHMNVRYFEMESGNYWFGGGIDLTPHYINTEDARNFHSGLKSVCDQFDENWYKKYKQWADDYFFLSHRNETRGVGGIFFDRLNESNTKLSKTELFHFVQQVGLRFTQLYSPLMSTHSDTQYGDTEIRWQSLRRSRYVEFNLLHDKGTKFGIDTNGRTESILMSMPPSASWEYNYPPPKNSEEEKTQILLRKGIDWINA